MNIRKHLYLAEPMTAPQTHTANINFNAYPGKTFQSINQAEKFGSEHSQSPIIYLSSWQDFSRFFVWYTHMFADPIFIIKKATDEDLDGIYRYISSKNLTDRYTQYMRKNGELYVVSRETTALILDS